MKKILAGLTLAIMAAAFLAPIAAAQTVPKEVTQCTLRHDFKSDTNWASRGFTCPDKDAVCLFSNTSYTCGSCCLIDTIYTITDWIFIGVTSLALIMLLIGAFNIITAGGSPEKVNTGRSYIIFAVVGMIIALMAKLIPVIAMNVMGLK